jgi:transposase-like protein
MDTSVVVESPGRRTHRRHSAEFKAQVIRACRQRGVSVAAVALANGLNANMLRRWVADAARGGPLVAGNPPGFVAVQLATTPAAPAQPDIHIELTRGPTTIAMRWPACLVGDWATWLREKLR